MKPPTTSQWMTLADSYEMGGYKVSEFTLRNAYSDFVEEIEAQYRVLERLFHISYVDYDPYGSAESMLYCTRAGELQVWTGENHHPILTPEQNLHFRAVHDLMGHHVSKSGFNAAGEWVAYCEHVPTIRRPWAKLVLFTEVVGQTAWLHFSESNLLRQANGEDKLFPEQKAILLDMSILKGDS